MYQIRSKISDIFDIFDKYDGV